MSNSKYTKMQVESLMFSSKATDFEHDEKSDFRTYKRRYYMLTLFSVCNVLNVTCWISSFLIRWHYEDLYGVGFFKARLAALLYPLLYLPSLLVATYIYNKYSLRVALYIGTILLAIGSWIKISINYSFDVMLVGQTIWAFGWPFFVNAPALLATRWFESSKRTIAITIASSSAIVGMFIGAVIPRIIVDRDYVFEEETGKVVGEKELRHQIMISFIIQGGWWVLLMILVLTTFQNKPEVPPSTDAIVYRDNDLVGTYWLLFTNREFLKLSLTFSLYFSVVSSLALCSDKIIKKFDYNDHDDELFEIISVISGIVGSLLYGIFLHKFKVFKLANIAIGISTLVSLIALTIWVNFEQKHVTAFLYGLVGFCAYPIVMLWYLYSSEIAYPIKETTASGVFLLGCLIISTATTQILKNVVMKQLDNQAGALISMSILILMAAIGLLLAILMRPINYERIAYIQNNVASNSFIANEASKHKLPKL